MRAWIIVAAMLVAAPLAHAADAPTTAATAPRATAVKTDVATQTQPPASKTEAQSTGKLEGPAAKADTPAAGSATETAAAKTESAEPAKQAEPAASDATAKSASAKDESVKEESAKEESAKDEKATAKKDADKKDKKKDTASKDEKDGVNPAEKLVERVVEIGERTTSLATRLSIGIASYYASRFHGRTTASGVPYDETEMTAAHRSLPFGTVLRVTNLSNLRSVIVKITDRGPYIRGRSIDLSRSAARKLGMLEPGLAKVKIEKIEAGEHSERTER